MTFQITPFWIALATVAAVLLVVSALSGLASRRLSPRLWTLLVACRAAVLGALLVAFLDPSVVRRAIQSRTAGIAVVLDTSESMTLPDATGTRTRWEAATREVERWREVLGEAGTLRVVGFGEEASAPAPEAATPESFGPDAPSSRIDPVLRRLIATSAADDLRHVLVVSDGRWDDAETAFETARAFRHLGIPISTFPVGGTTEQPDLRVLGIRVRQPDPFEPLVRTEVELESPGFAGADARVTVRSGDRVLHEQTVRLAGGAQSLEFRFRTPYRGFHSYSLEIEQLEGERLAGNNRIAFGLTIDDPRIRVLYMEGTADATDALEDGLEEDPAIEVTSLYFPQYQRSMSAARQAPYQTDRSGRRIYNVAHPRRGFPTTLEGLLEYDVVINSDIFKEAFTAEQLTNTVALVEDFGGGFVMVGGHTAFGAGHYDETVIDKLMPVDVYGARDIVNQFFNIRVPDAARDHPILQVGITKEETREAWDELFPGFGGMNRANRAKPGALTLAVHEQARNQYGPLIVFAVQQIGRGRTMAFTPDTTYSWGTQFQDNWGNGVDQRFYYKRFWNNAVRWLAADRMVHRHSQFRVVPPEHPPSVGDPLIFHIPESPEWSSERLRVRVLAPDGTSRDVEWMREPLENRFTAVVRPDQPGPWIAEAELLINAVSSRKARALADVTDGRNELATTVAQPENLRRLAMITRGLLLTDRDPAELKPLLERFAGETVVFRSRSVWDRWPFLVLIAGLLGIEWILRRRAGLM